MGDILTKVAPSLGENIVFAKIDTDKYPALASQHRIEALPTLVLFKHGHAVDRIEGVLSADALRARLLKHVDAP